MTKVTFYGLPAWVGAIHGPTICDWWNADPAQLNWDRSLLYTVDLAKTPSAANAGYIAASQIEVDDHTRNGGRTTIGPMWPGGTTIGACWVSDSYLARAGGTAPGAPATAGSHKHEHTTIHYFDGEHGNRRFHGFQASVVKAHGPLSLVEIWNPGTSAASAKPAGSWWLDLAADADPSTPPPAPGTTGPLYLDAAKVNHMAMFSPKFPPYVGTFGFAPPPSRSPDRRSPGPKRP